MNLEMPVIKSPMMIFLDHESKGFPYKDIDSVVWLVESRLNSNLPIVNYEDMVSILRQLKSYQALIDDLQGGAYY